MKSRNHIVPCPHYKECGGCSLIHLPYAEQLGIKEELLWESFREWGFQEKDLKKCIKKIRPSPVTLGYRNKAKWVLEADGDDIKMGIYYPGTHKVVDIPKCSVHAPLINELSFEVKTLLKKHSVRVDAHETREPCLRYVIVRYSFRQRKLIAVFVSNQRKVQGLNLVFDELRKKFPTKLLGLVQNINKTLGNVLLGEANRFVFKGAELVEGFSNFKVPVGPLSFLQVNTTQASYLYKRVTALLGPGPFEVGIDLFSGVGLFGMHMASRTETIVAVEEMGSAVLEALTASRRNRIQNIMPICSDALEGLEVFSSEYRYADWLILNPPRKGCDAELIEALGRMRVLKMVYVSCNPRSLARDLKMLIDLNPQIRLKSLEPVDMFPQTEHFETIAVLENTQIDLDGLDPDQPALTTRKSLSRKRRAIH